MGIIDRVINAVSPGTALKRARARYETINLEAQSEALEARLKILGTVLPPGRDIFTNSGYSHGGASRRRTWAREWDSESGSAKRDIEENRKLLRERSRDLFMSAPLATGAVKSSRTPCIGPGLMPKPKIDYEFLGITQEEANRIQRLIKKEFAIWAESTLCDNNDLNNFYELQQVVFSDWLNNGEEFVLIKYGKPLKYMPYQLRLSLVEADRVCTEGNYDGGYDGYDKKAKNGNTIINGVETDEAGKVVAYHIASRFPGEYGSGSLKWARVEKRGAKTGNPNILHIFNAERAGQYRGVPFLAPVIQTLKQLTRYTEAEIMAAVVNSLFGIFITTKAGEEIEGFGGNGEEAEEKEGDVPGVDEDKIKVGTGTVTFLREGEEVKAVESAHPSNNYDAFVNSMALQIGAALEIAPEVLLKKFSNNFSSSKGALNETWKSFKMYRKWFIDDFCQEVYVLWFNEAVSKGRVNAPGYFDNILVKKAYTNATWNGPAQGHLNPVQEVTAAILKIQNGLSTHEDECTSMNGSDYENNIRTLKTENTLLAEAQAGNVARRDKDGGKD
jgi:phage portal protein, lambda family